MTYNLEYSQIVRQKMKDLKSYLTDMFGYPNAMRTMESIFSSIDTLGVFPLKGISLSEMYEIETEYRFIFTNHNYIFYYIEGETVYIIEMFDEKEDFMLSLFGLSSESEESVQYWGE